MEDPTRIEWLGEREREDEEKEEKVMIDGKRKWIVKKD